MRIYIVLDNNAKIAIETLRKNTTAETATDVLRDALGVYLTLYEMLQKMPEGYLALVDKERQEVQELRVPSIQQKPGEGEK